MATENVFYAAMPVIAGIVGFLIGLLFRSQKTPETKQIADFGPGPLPSRITAETIAADNIAAGPVIGGGDFPVFRFPVFDEGVASGVVVPWRAEDPCGGDGDAAVASDPHPIETQMRTDG